MQVVLDELFQFRAIDQRNAIAVRELLARPAEPRSRHLSLVLWPTFACSFAARSASRRCAAMRRSHSDRPPPLGTAVTLRLQATTTCLTITAADDQIKRLASAYS